MRISKSLGAATNEDTGSVGFVIFCAFVVSYFIHLAARLPVLGVLRVDLLLAGATAASILMAPKPIHSRNSRVEPDPANKLIWILLGYVVLTLPFVEWPGSVLRLGLDPFIKAACFYFFVVGTVNTVSRLKTFLAIFVGCQVFRVLEPLYLHVTQGYWGSFTHMGNWEFMDRLSGAPHDTVNPNGLAFIILMALPLLHYLIAPTTFLKRMIWLGLIGAMLYVLILTSSRSGFVVLICLALYTIFRSKNRAALLAVLAITAVVGFSLMSDLQRERYLSLVSSDAKGAETSQGRVDGVKQDFEVALRKPFFGHGLGTSLEANANFRGYAQLSHNLYTEVAQELGFVGLFIFLWFIRAVVRNCVRTQKQLAAAERTESSEFLSGVSASLITLIFVFMVFSLASYGLSEPHWYLAGGLSVALVTIARGIAGTSQISSSGSRSRSIVPTKTSDRFA